MDEDIDAAYEELLHQSSALFMEQISSLTSYQMNYLKAIVDGVHTGFTRNAVLSTYSLGSKSNVSKIEHALIEMELIEKHGEQTNMTDPVFAQWFRRGCKK